MKQILTLLLLICLLNANSQVNSESSPQTPAIQEADEFSDSLIISDEVIFNSFNQKSADYREARTKYNNLVHTKLEFSFDWISSTVFGKASITLNPHFYPTNELILDAKGFDIQSVELLKPKKNLPLQYDYNQTQLSITLDKKYTKAEQYQVVITYKVKPSNLQSNSGVAITDDRGLYFINADGSRENLPQQIWTQSETESASCWFPTIDSPNQRSTEEMYITVENKFVTLSNGLMLKSVKNSNGTRTDYWKQDLPHAPYLFMLAVGEYAVVKDKWRNIEVNYYVEPQFKNDAKAIFGKTPKMLEFYSNIFRTDYPWAKYSQIPVRNFVSGAMENTTATVFGQFVQKTTRELMDKNDEDVISHELSHHWFGDLVTCESWANTTLNEGFATYSEYLWYDFEYGKVAADHHIWEDLDNYLSESAYKKVPLIRYNYVSRDDMFDAHSYQKGCLVLNLLRSYVGDSAFFDAVKLYLDRYRFKSAEVHDLRLVFEEVTGEDLNWFFNQWFFQPGHPMLSISNTYNEATKQTSVQISQEQKSDNVFQIPLKIDYYFPDTIIRQEVLITEAKQVVVFQSDTKPLLVNVDADKTLICEKNDEKTTNEWVVQYRRSEKFFDKIEALEKLRLLTDNKDVKDIFFNALSHPFWYIRAYSIQHYSSSVTKGDTLYLAKLQQLAFTDPSSEVRQLAVSRMAIAKNPQYIDVLFKVAETDSSIMVLDAVFEGVKNFGSEYSLALAKKFLSDSKYNLQSIEIYAKFGSLADSSLFQKTYFETPESDRWRVLNAYAAYATHFNDSLIDNALQFFYSQSRAAKAWWVRGACIHAASKILDYYSFEEYKLGSEQKNGTENNSEKVKMLQARQEQIRQKMKEIILAETNADLIEWYKAYRF